MEISKLKNSKVTFEKGEIYYFTIDRKKGNNRAEKSGEQRKKHEIENT